MIQSCAPATQTDAELLERLQTHNQELRKYLAAQRAVATSLERRVGRSLTDLDVHVQQLVSNVDDTQHWPYYLASTQYEVERLCDLVSDTLLLQKLEAGKVDVKLEPFNPQPLLECVTRHLLEPRDGSASRLICEIAPDLPPIVADHELCQAVLTDLLARGLRYSAETSPVVLGVQVSAAQIHLKVTAQHFAPPGNRDFATEIVLCCRQVEVQQGTVLCEPQSDGRQTVTISLPRAV